MKKKHPDEVWVRYSYDPHEMPQKVCYTKNNFDYVQHSPDRLYKSAPIPIKKAKAADLKKLANDYVPRGVRDMYLNLLTTDDTTADYTVMFTKTILYYICIAVTKLYQNILYIFMCSLMYCWHVTNK